MKEVEIQGRKIGDNHTPFVIAEMSGNHNQSLERALEIVEAATRLGCRQQKHLCSVGILPPSQPQNLWYLETIDS